MAIDANELAELRDELVRLRARGLRELRYDGKVTVYADDAEMAAAISDLDRRIAASAGAPVRVVRPNMSKGF